MNSAASIVERLHISLKRGLYDIRGWITERWDVLDLWVDKSFRDQAHAVDGALVQQFKQNAAAIEDAPVPLTAQASLYVAVSLLVIAVLWAVFGTLDRIVVAPGKIATRTPMIVLQSFSTAKITRINVKPGDHVKKGQVLVLFDSSFAHADKASLQQKVLGLAAEADRIDAEMKDAPGLMVDAADDRERRIQAQIFEQEMSEYSAELAVRDSRMKSIETQIRSDDAAVIGLKKQLEMAKRIVAIQKNLLSQKAGAPLDVMKAESGEIEAEIRLKNTVEDAQKLAEQRTEMKAERQSFLDKWRSDHSQQLVQARRNLSETVETLSKARRMEDFTQLKAPADGVVLEIAERSVGSVLREGETLVTLVPDVADLFVEANVPSRDVSYIKVGNSVRVKLEAYPFQKIGTLSGKLDVIGADSISLKQDSSRAELVYRAQIRILETPRQLAARGINLRPGLVATAEIKTGKRSIASYILNPVLRTADESMREP